ncbi:MAG TPA: type II secretion system minor pseudopilin GspJ [Steroidobacteraceae bacterium]|nr:type II secretion system minor pseudopilin GspJ [Steroidobacteraceae bacterium]
MRQRGFTLIELLVAMFIAAIMFAIGYGALNQGLKNQDALKEQQQRLRDMQTTMRLLEQDFVELAPRPVRQPVGEGWLPALLGQADPNVQPIVQLTRGGWSNPTGLQRPGLQRVAYFLEKNTLRREYWTVLDPTLTDTTEKQNLLTHVKSLTFRFMDVSRQWLTQWPPNAVAGATGQESALRMRPIAVEITLDTEDWGKLVRIIEVAG